MDSMELQGTSANHLLKAYCLTEENCNKEVSDRHLEEISRLHSREWKSLPSYLDIESIVADDMDHGVGNQHEKRLNFFLQWKQMKGSDATYFRLISALLKIKCRKDAESVCKLLQVSLKQKESSAEKTLGELTDTYKGYSTEGAGNVEGHCYS